MNPEVARAPVPGSPRVVHSSGREGAAWVHVAEMRSDPDLLVEFVDAVDPRYPRDEKWVVILSSQFGCPVACAMCETGRWYRGNLTAEEMLWQVDQVVLRRHPDRVVRSRKFKVQFARMGEPSLNPEVLRALRLLRTRYEAPGLIACVTTTAPRSRNTRAWFDALRLLKSEAYRGGAFQLQFSINTTDESVRDRIMPVRKWSLAEVARYGETFFEPGDRKVVLNFALAQGWPVEVDRVASICDPSCFVIKLTPLNPTSRAQASGLRTVLAPGREQACEDLTAAFRANGFEVIISIGSEEEIAIRSNCGQAVRVGFASAEPSRNRSGPA